MKKINTLNFSVFSNTKKKKSHKGIALIAIVIILIGIISLFFILTKNGYNINKVLGIRDEETLISETTEVFVTPTSTELDFTDSVNFLAICHDDENAVSFAFIFSLLPDEYRIRIKPLDPDMSITVFTGERTFSDAFQSVNIDQLIEGLANKNIPVDRYILLSEDDFISVIQALGSVSINLESEFEYYSNSIKYICPAGYSEFTSDALLAYMKHNGEGDSKLEYSSLGAKTIIETFYTEENVSKGEALFTKLINLVSTDITVFDYVSAQSAIETLCRNGFSITINL